MGPTQLTKVENLIQDQLLSQYTHIISSEFSYSVNKVYNYFKSKGDMNEWNNINCIITRHV